METTMDIDKYLNSDEAEQNRSENSDNNLRSADSQQNQNSNEKAKGWELDKSDELIAKLEMERLNKSSAYKVNNMKSKISAYLAAKEISEEAARETEIGELLNDPDVWEHIANKILG